MPNTDAKMTGPLDLPMQPAGSGVADLEMAREQDALAGDGVLQEDAGIQGDAVEQSSDSSDLSEEEAASQLGISI